MFQGILLRCILMSKKLNSLFALLTALYPTLKSMGFTAISIKNHVLPDRKIATQNEIKRNQELLNTNPTARVNRHHQNFLAKWWLLSYPRPELIQKINTISRYIVCVCKQQAIAVWATI